jgi:hypothetical protein
MSISSKIALAMSANGASFEEVHTSLEKLADEFAIGFAEWLQVDVIIDLIENHTTRELLEIYKKEKQL